MVDITANCNERSVVRCSYKRTKPVTPNQLNDLPDELLVEILCRLPNSAFAIRCKCVCKRCSSLISNPSFITRFIARRMKNCAPYVEIESGEERAMIGNERNSVSNLEEQSFAIIARVISGCRPHQTWKGMMMHFSDPNLNPHNFSISPLPSFVDRTATPPIVMGTCNDLLLCCNQKDDINRNRDYYLCNVQTKEWLQISSPPFYHKYGIIVGFICDPFYSYEIGRHGSNVFLNDAYRYCIVVIPYTHLDASQFNAHLFSSTNNQWTKIVLSLPEQCQLLSCTHGFGYSSMLHFYTNKGMIGFDPYKIVNNVAQCHLVGPWPPCFPCVSACLGVRQGHLQICNTDYNNKLSIWVLKEYEKGEWKLEHSIESEEWIIHDECLVKYNTRHGRLGDVIGAHPIDPDVIYMLGPSWIALCNARMRTAEIVACLSEKSMQKYGRYKYFPLMFPVWPTPISGGHTYHSLIR